MKFEVPDMAYIHSALIGEIHEAFWKGDLQRCRELWHCYDVMFNPPSIRWDLKWRQQWGYPAT